MAAEPESDGGHFFGNFVVVFMCGQKLYPVWFSVLRPI